MVKSKKANQNNSTKMTAPLNNPGQPYLQQIPGGFSPGKVAHLTGIFNMNAANLVLKFQSGPYGDPNDEIGLCIYGRLNENILGLNSFTHTMGWGQEKPLPNQGFVRGQPFELAILCDPGCFKIAINQQHMGEMAHAMNPALLSHFNVVSGSNDITVSCIWIEDPSGAPPLQQAPYSAPLMGAPGPYQPLKQQNYQEQNASYPHSGTKNKGLMGMVGSAGAAVAGALGASHLLGKSKGHSSAGGYGGYPGGQPQYGGYPGAQQPQYGGYPGAQQPQYGGYPGAQQPQYGGYPPGGGHKSGGGILNKALGLGGGLLGAKAMSKGMGGFGGGSKAMKYGIPLAGAGVGGYMLSKGIGKSFSFDGSGSDSD